MTNITGFFQQMHIYCTACHICVWCNSNKHHTAIFVRFYFVRFFVGLLLNVRYTMIIIHRWPVRMKKKKKKTEIVAIRFHVLCLYLLIVIMQLYDGMYRTIPELCTYYYDVCRHIKSILCLAALIQSQAMAKWERGAKGKKCGGQNMRKYWINGVRTEEHKQKITSRRTARLKRDILKMRRKAITEFYRTRKYHVNRFILIIIANVYILHGFRVTLVKKSKDFYRRNRTL